MYYNVKEDSSGKLYLSKEEEPLFSEKYTLYDKSNNHMYPNQFMAYEADGDGHLYAGMDRLDLSNVIPITVKEAADIFSNLTAEKPHVIKDVKSKVVNPKDTNYPFFTKIVVKAILKYGKDISLSTEDHKRKVALVNSINKLGETGDKEITMGKAREILKLFTINIENIFKQDLLD